MLQCEVTSVATKAARVHPGVFESASLLSVLQLYFTFTPTFSARAPRSLHINTHSVHSHTSDWTHTHIVDNIQMLPFIPASQIFGTALLIVRPPSPHPTPPTSTHQDTFFLLTLSAPRVQQEPGLHGNPATKCQSALWALCAERSARHLHMLPSRYAASCWPSCWPSCQLVSVTWRSRWQLFGLRRKTYFRNNKMDRTASFMDIDLRGVCCNSPPTNNPRIMWTGLKRCY